MAISEPPGADHAKKARSEVDQLRAEVTDQAAQTDQAKQASTEARPGLDQRPVGCLHLAGGQPERCCAAEAATC